MFGLRETRPAKSFCRATDFDAASALKRLSQGLQDARARQIQALEREVVRASLALFEAEQKHADGLRYNIAGVFVGDPDMLDLSRLGNREDDARAIWRHAVERLEAELGEGE